MRIFFGGENILKNISHGTILPEIDAAPPNHLKFLVSLSIFLQKIVQHNFWRFFVFPAKGVPLPGEFPSTAVTGFPGISGASFGAKIAKFLARPKMFQGCCRIIPTNIWCDLDAFPAHLGAIQRAFRCFL